MDLAHTIQWQGAAHTYRFAGSSGFQLARSNSHESAYLNPLLNYQTGNKPAAWNEPILFEPLDTPEIPTAGCPACWVNLPKPWLTPVKPRRHLSVMTILGVLSTALAGHCAVSPKPGWIEPINIYTLIALPPANHKSLVVRACTQPLWHWEKEQKKQRENDIKRQRAARKTEERILENLRSKPLKRKIQTNNSRLFEVDYSTRNGAN